MQSLRNPTAAERRFLALTVAAGVLGAGLAVYFAQAGQTALAQAASDAAQLAAAATAAGACLVRSRRGGEEARAWRWLGRAAGIWTAAALVWFAYGVSRGHVYPFPSVADIGFLAYVVPAIVGLAAFPMGSERLVARRETIIDAAVIAMSAIFISWATVLGKVYRASGGGAGARLVALSYPTVDLVIVALVLALGVRMRAGARLPFAYLGAGLLLLAITDSVYVARTFDRLPTIATPIAAGWTVAWLLVALAAIAPATERTAVVRRLNLFQELLPYAPVAVAIVVATVHRVDFSGDPLLLGLGVALLGLTAARQALLTQDHLALATDLEQIVERRTAALVSQDRWFASLVRNSSDAISVIGAGGQLRWQSPAVETMLGHCAEELAKSDWFELVHPDDVANVRRAIVAASSEPRRTGLVEARLLDVNGTSHDVEIKVTNLLDDDSVAGLVLNVREVAERKALEERVRHQAFHDPLTGLANRLLFADRVTQALGRARRTGADLAVLFLDLDNFKEVNDTLGHAAGDAVLVATGERLRASVRPDDTVARFGGDEFAVLLEDYGGAETLDRVAQRIVDTVTAPVCLSDVEIPVGTSMGIVSAGPHGTVDELLRNADLAMYAVKASGKGGYAHYAPQMHASAVARRSRVDDLRRALGTDEFVVFFQPKVSLATSAVVGFEALVRWAHPERGLVSPAEFIELAEETGTIGELGEIVLRESCRQLASWQRTVPGAASLSVAVNLSARQLGQPDLVSMVERVLHETGLAADSLELEITETAIMEDVQAVVPVLTALKELGVSLAIDDFGTGYSSLNYLKRFPVDSLKIDRSFVAGLGRDRQDAALVSAVVALAKALRMTSVAEGVETFEQLVDLTALGCDYVQGFFLGGPQAADRAIETISESRGARAVLRVLVCDDDPVTRMLYRASFEASGATVAEAVDGADALARAESFRPELVTLDLNMPKVDGMTALRQFRALVPDATVMIVSATTAAAVVERGFDTGAVAFFDKDRFPERIPALVAEYRRVAKAPTRDVSVTSLAHQ
ncbi:MAG: EAL domain-containing protein [Frankia sp.]|nr:EAL domain-containing protein [Frankia sp.]